MSHAAPGLVVRAPNHLGDLVMALPALEASGGADVLVTAWLAPLLGLAREAAAESGSPTALRRVIPLARGTAGMWEAATELRRARYARGVLLTPSISSALVFFAGRVRERRGFATDARGFLLSDPLDPDVLSRVHRSAVYLILTTGETPAAPPPPRLPLPGRVREGFRALAGPAAGPRVGIFPGSNASSRRWDPDRFAELARRLHGQGAEVLVFGGPGERDLTARVAEGGAVDLGGRTDLGLLAAGLADCSLVVSNDSGPLHLAAAVGTPTVSLWGAGDPARTGVRGGEHRLIRHAELPCVPCVRNECPRSGPGYVLPDAERECLAVIGVDEVEGAVIERLGRTTH